MNASVRVLGIDPGTRILGYGVVEGTGSRVTAVAHGVVRAPAVPEVATRLAALARGLREVIAAYRPAEAAVEEAFHGRDARAALKIGEARGMVLLILAEAGIAVAGYANNVVKRAVTGAGRAPKERVQSMVQRLLGLAVPPHPFDAADALALALCHLHRRGAPWGTSERAGPSERVRLAILKAGGRTRPR